MRKLLENGQESMLNKNGEDKLLICEEGRETQHEL